MDVRGRSRTLRINYRTSHQIRRQADRLLAPELADVDGVVEDRRGAMSVFNGPGPSVLVLEDEDSEVDVVADWLSKREAEGTAPEEIGVIVRSEAEVPRACRAVERAGIPYRVLDEQTPPGAGRASISTMHMAKGLEFRAVAVMACGDEVVPLQDRIESVSDEADLLEVYDTERHLLYVAATRARDLLLVTGVAPGSEFIDDMRTAETDQF